MPATDPSTWTAGATQAYIGDTSSGTLTVDGGSGLNTAYGYLGYAATATGLVNVAGIRLVLVQL